MVCGVILSCVGLATFLLLPPFVEGMVTDLRATESQAGVVASVLALGTTLSGLLAPLWIRRTSWRAAGAAGLTVMLAANLACVHVHQLVPFTVLTGIVGLCAGSLYSLALTVLSDCRRPGRYFAYAIGAQTAYQVLGLLAAPALRNAGGINGVLWLFAGLCVLGLLLLPLMPAHGRGDARASAGPTGGLLTAPTVLALVGCFLFYINIGAYWTYIERIGVAAGLAEGPISTVLSTTTALSLAGVALAAWLGDRRGFLAPIGWSAVVIVVSMLMLTGHLRMPAYFV